MMGRGARTRTTSALRRGARTWATSATARASILALTAAILAWAHPAIAQPAGKTFRIGYLSAGSSAGNPLLVEAFRQGLRERGWVEGRNIDIEYRWAEGHFDRLQNLAEELVRLNVDVIAASPTPGVIAAKNATKTIPIVGMGLTDPVALGVVGSLARPGGNVTGVTYSVGSDIFGKDLALLREVSPKLRRVAVLSNPSSPARSPTLGNIETAARAMGVQLVMVDASGPMDLDGAFAAITKGRAEAVLVITDPAYSGHRKRLTALAVRNRLPSIFTQREDVEAGALMSYGPKLTDLWQRGAIHVDKILRGAKPGDLPVEQPTTFELAINLKTAKILGVSVPPSLLARADTVIE
jgi:putative ABC transport system substrate-binding protein